MRKNQSRKHGNQNNPHEYKAKNKHEHEKNRDDNLIEAEGDLNYCFSVGVARWGFDEIMNREQTRFCQSRFYWVLSCL